MRWDFVMAVLDFIAPPRQSEKKFRTLTLSRLRELATEHGEELPYREEDVKSLIWEMKYQGSPRALHLAGEILAEELLAAASEELGTPLLIPIPMHPTRRKERGHNQTELLCEAALSCLPEGTFEYEPLALVRVRNTVPQQGLPKQMRLRNVKNSMAATGPRGGTVAGRACIVVDDVYTTGATFEEAKRALRGAGARAVHCIALARS